MVDAWQKHDASQKFLLTITPQGGSDIEAVGWTQGLRITMGGKDVTQEVLNNGGRIAVFNPSEPTEITFKEFTVGVADPDGLFGLFAKGDASSQSGSLDESRKKCRLAIMWTTDTTATSGAGSTAVGAESFRLVFKNAYLTSDELNFDENVLTSELTFKVIPFDKSGTSQIDYEKQNTGDASGLTALGSY